MSRALYAFYVYCGRMGELEGMFVRPVAEVEAAYGKTAYFSDVLGKHSEFEIDLDAECLTVKSDDQDFIDKLVDVMGGTHLSGLDPLDYINDDGEEE